MRTRWRIFRLNLRWLLLAGTLALLTACTLPLPGRSLQPAAVREPVDAGPSIQDARSLVGGVCFDYWAEQANRLYVIQSAVEHITFYNEVDESGLCRLPVIREPYDFEAAGRILVGAVNLGAGCTAYTNPVAFRVDDAAQTITLRVHWGVEGDCPYRLARPFWVSIPRPPEGYTVLLEAVPAPGSG